MTTNKNNRGHSPGDSPGHPRSLRDSYPDIAGGIREVPPDGPDGASPAPVQSPDTPSVSFDLETVVAVVTVTVVDADTARARRAAGGAGDTGGGAGGGAGDTVKFLLLFFLIFLGVDGFLFLGYATGHFWTFLGVLGGLIALPFCFMCFVWWRCPR